VREWLAAAKADAETKAIEFRKALTNLGIQENAAKPWWQASKLVLECYTGDSARVQDIIEITNWMHDIQVLAQGADILQVCQLIALIHKRVKAESGAVERQRVQAWLKILGLGGANMSLTHCSKFVKVFLKAGPGCCTRPELAELWTMAGVAHHPFILDLCPKGEVPEWLPKACKHTFGCTTKTFWFSDVHFASDAPRVKAVGEWLYATLEWQTQQDATQRAVVALSQLTLTSLTRLLRMFTVANWLTLCGAAGVVPLADIAECCSEMADSVPAQKRRRVGNAMTSGTLSDMGQWILLHREVIVLLIDADYPAKALVKAYEEELEHRELVAITWFKGTKPDTSDNHLVSMKALDQHGAEKHGFVFANIGHLAERHLYLHFQFDRPPLYQGEQLIKNLNSFHPRGTTQLMISQIASPMRVKDVDDSLQLINNYQVGVKITTRGSRISCLYPDLNANDVDYFTRDKLVRIKNVLQVISADYSNALTELVWFATPRANARL
jgi:hypothetical protein